MGLEDVLTAIIRHPFESLMTGVLVYVLIQAYAIFRPQTEGRWGALMDQNLAAALTSIELLGVIGTVGLLVLVGSYVLDDSGF
ncbi:hypothetical protein SAMN04487950_1046 [Halogranum rubrum]|uniref:Copper resistance protein D n=1 Tax=Halogranum rubrum TaxID=553466 RepID=A0A1I4CBX5_9EURY|nr:hypothetical protein SAMN04487950_1046 [Halogranum rubrum]